MKIQFLDIPYTHFAIHFSTQDELNNLCNYLNAYNYYFSCLGSSYTKIKPIKKLGIDCFSRESKYLLITRASDCHSLNCCSIGAGTIGTKKYDFNEIGFGWLDGSLNQEENKMGKNNEINTNMKLNDLQSGMIVELENRNLFFVMNDCLMSSSSCIRIAGNYTDNLLFVNSTLPSSIALLGIAKVYRVISNTNLLNICNYMDRNCLDRELEKGRVKLIYDRSYIEPKEMTVEQICRELGYNVKIVK